MAEREQRREGQEGNRWVNVTPSAEELAAWFEANVKVEEGLSHADYIGGLVLIPATEKTKGISGWEGNSPTIGDFEDLVFTPYIRVETRLKYFRDLCEKESWLGVIEPADIEEPDKKLPPGYFRMAIATGEGRESRYIGCSKKVTVYKAASVRYEIVTLDKRTGEQGKVRLGDIELDAPAGTKVVATLKSGRQSTWADDNAVMKAETGAIGRALGMAGMLVIPGSGIATAEDVQESRAAEAAGPSADSATLPEAGTAAVIPESAPGEGTDEKMREEITTILAAMEKEYPEVHKQFLAWAKEKKFGRLSEIVSPQLRGMHRKATTMYNEAGQAKSAESEKKGDKPAAQE